MEGGGGLWGVGLGGCLILSLISWMTHPRLCDVQYVQYVCIVLSRYSNVWRCVCKWQSSGEC